MGKLACSALGGSRLRAVRLTIAGQLICRFGALRDSKIVLVGGTIILVDLRLKG